MIQRGVEQVLDGIIKRHGKMAFLSGPRQVGKTTLAHHYQKQFSQSLYFNWDDLRHQKKLLKNPYFFQEENRDPSKPFLVVLDEIHKYSKWKNYLKGAYDSFHESYRFLVTGSGRLDLYKKGGDSLLGRYFSAFLFPLTCGELAGRLSSWEGFEKLLSEGPPPARHPRSVYETLFEMSGFPEPMTKGEKNFYQQWFQERKTLLIREDIRDASRIRDLSLLETLSHLIPERVGSPLSINALREDVGVAFETVRDWILLLERFYYLFRLRPYTVRLARGLKKETKAYLYDWVEVEDLSLRFENMAALHLFKAVETWRSMGEGALDLHYVRDKEKREVDFLITRNRRPFCLVECKYSEDRLSPHLAYFQEKLSVPFAVQLVHPSGVCKKIKAGKWMRWILSADRWLESLP